MDKNTLIGNGPLSENPREKLNFRIGNKAVKNKHLDDEAVDSRVLMEKAVTPKHLSDSVQRELVLSVTNPLDTKYSNITAELKQMIKSLQVGGVALSNQFGDSEDIGITQKTLTNMFGKILDIFSNVPSYIPETKSISFLGNQIKRDFSLSVEPTLKYSVNPVNVEITADCTGSIVPFDYIRIYVDDELKAESQGIYVFNTAVTLSKSSTVKAVGMIAGKEITKQQEVVIEVPFFMGSGSIYTDVMNVSCQKELEGSIEGSYDVAVTHDNDYLFIIIPITSKDEYRRADMNGYEIPVTKTEMAEFVVYKSQNRYKAGVYNVDIDINS